MDGCKGGVLVGATVVDDAVMDAFPIEIGVAGIFDFYRLSRPDGFSRFSIKDGGDE